MKALHLIMKNWKRPNMKLLGWQVLEVLLLSFMALLVYILLAVVL